MLFDPKVDWFETIYSQPINKVQALLDSFANVFLNDWKHSGQYIALINKDKFI